MTLSVLYEQLGIQMCPANTKDGVCSGNGVSNQTCTDGLCVVHCEYTKCSS